MLRCFSLAPTDSLPGEAVSKARVATEVLFGAISKDLSTSDVIAALCDDPRLKRCSRQEMVNETVVNLAARHGLASSKSTICQ